MRLWRIFGATLLVIVTWLTSASVGGSVGAQSNSWVTKAHLLVANTGLAAATGSDGRIYTFGGTDNATTDYNDAERYDPATDTWSAIALLPVAESYPSAIAGADGKIYIFGGFDSLHNRSLNTVFAYDPATNTYACSGSYPGCASTSLRPMPVARATMAITQADNGEIWTIGGYNSVPVPIVEVYDPAANTWRGGPPLPTGDAGPVAFSLNGSIVVNGGFDGQRYINTSYVLNLLPPAATTARRSSGEPARNQRHTTFPDSLYFCRHDEPGATIAWVDENINDPQVYARYYKKFVMQPDEIDVYVRLLTRRRLTKTAFNKAVAEYCHEHAGNQSVFRIDQDRAAVGARQAASSIQLPPLVFAGGVGPGGVSSEVGVYDWLAQTVTAGPSLPAPREAGAAAYGADGTVYVIGGDDGARPYNTVWSYTPKLMTLNLAAATIPTPTSVAATSTSTPTATAAPTATATAVSAPLTVRIKLKSSRVASGHTQQITVTTLPGTRVGITATLPNKKKLRHAGAAGTTGTFAWRYKEPVGFRAGLSVKIAVAVTDATGRTAHASARYTTG